MVEVWRDDLERLSRLWRDCGTRHGRECVPLLQDW